MLGSDNKTPLLTSKSTPANLAILQKNLSGSSPAYSSFFANNATSTIAQSLVAFPQYSGISDVWGNVANISYNSLQVSVNQRMSHGISYTLNYTWSKNLGDDGTYRSGYAIPAGATSNGLAYKANRIDRSQTVNNIPHNLSMYGVFQSPFGKNKMGGQHFLVRALAGDWQLSNIFTYNSGTPLVLTYATCTAPNAGQCMPDLNPNYVGTGRKNGHYGQGITAANIGSSQYLDPAAFQAPGQYPNACTGTNCVLLNKIGTAPRTAPYGIHGTCQSQSRPQLAPFLQSVTGTLPLHLRGRLPQRGQPSNPQQSKWRRRLCYIRYVHGRLREPRFLACRPRQLLTATHTAEDLAHLL